MIGTENMVKHKELLIIGAGGHGKVAADIARKCEGGSGLIS